MARGGRQKDHDEGPERRCIVTGQSQPASGLVRFAIGPDMTVVPDIMGKLPGRGIWVSARRDAIETAGTRKLFVRAARAQVIVPEGLADTVHDLLTRRVIDLVSMARKAGQAVAGYEKTRDALNSGQMALLIQASDGSERGKTKLRPPEGRDTHLTCLTAQEIGLAFGREHVIHAALAAGGLASRVVEEAARLASMRGLIGGDVPIGED